MKKIISLSFAVLLLGTSIGSATDLTQEEQEEYGRRAAGQKMTKDDSQRIFDEIIAARTALPVASKDYVKSSKVRGRQPTIATVKMEGCLQLTLPNQSLLKCLM